MAIHPGLRSASQPASPLETLVRARGLQRFGLFFVTGEGDYLPNGDEEKSGYVIDGLGDTYSFWTGWDAERREVVFTEWELVPLEPEWLEVGEYQRARAAAGLSQLAAPVRRPAPAYIRWRDEDGIDRVIPGHLIEQAVSGVATIIMFLTNKVGSALDHFRQRAGRVRRQRR
jgi:hypothetical protein